MDRPPMMPSGWFPDPHGRYDFRWFNGTAWTADVSNDGQRQVDPLGAAPSGWYPPASQTGPGNGIATAAITCGLIAVLFAWMPFLVVAGFVLGVLALVFGIKGIRRARTAHRGRGLAITGVVCGGTALALSAVGVVFTVSVSREVHAFLSPGRVRIDGVECRAGSGEIVISGDVTNLSESTRDYTLYGVLTVPGGPDVVREIDDVAPGERRAFELHRVFSGELTGGCMARVAVHGPLPYDLEVDRVFDPRR